MTDIEAEIFEDPVRVALWNAAIEAAAKVCDAEVRRQPMASRDLPRTGVAGIAKSAAAQCAWKVRQLKMGGSK